MPWGPRITETSNRLAEGDKLYFSAEYNDTSGSLTAFMPVYKDLSEAAEYNNINNATQVTVGPLAKLQSAGRVVTGSNNNASAKATGSLPLCVGIYSPTNAADVPSIGDVIRVMRIGSTPVQISSGQNPHVGDFIIGDWSQNLALTMTPSNGAGLQPSVGNIIGRVLGTAGQISAGQAISPVPSGKLGFLVNGYVDLR